MLRKVAICVLLASPFLATGCGSSDDATSDEDKQAITKLVDEVNSATQAKDASAFCLIIQPSAVEETFHGIDRCVKETKPILEAAGDQPTLEVENIEVDGDVAKVSFKGGTGGEVNFVREGSQWYVPLTSEDAGAKAGEPSGGELPDPEDVSGS